MSLQATHGLPAVQSRHRVARFDLRGVPVDGIEPVDGWALYVYDERDLDGFGTDAYFARGPLRDVFLPVSRFHFTPTQARFAWLVNADFPPTIERPGGIFTPWCDSDIDAHLLAEAYCAAVSAGRVDEAAALLSELMGEMAA